MKFLWIAVAALFGVAAFAVWFSFRDPVFITGLVAAAVASFVNAIKPTILKRMTPEQEKKMQECHRRGGTWDNFRKKCRD